MEEVWNSMSGDYGEKWDMAKAGCQNLIPLDFGCLQISMLVFQKQWVTRKIWHILQLNVGGKKKKKQNPECCSVQCFIGFCHGGCFLTLFLVWLYGWKDKIGRKGLKKL